MAEVQPFSPLQKWRVEAFNTVTDRIPIAIWVRVELS
jgi:hypothetical protein